MVRKLGYDNPGDSGHLAQWSAARPEKLSENPETFRLSRFSLSLLLSLVNQPSHLICPGFSLRQKGQHHSLRGFASAILAARSVKRTEAFQSSQKISFVCCSLLITLSV